MMKFSNKMRFSILFSLLLIVVLIIQIQSIKENNKFYNELKRSFDVLRDPTRHPDGTSYKGKKFVNFTLEDISGRVWHLEDIKSPIKIIALFSVKNCSECLQDYRLWKKIDEIYSDSQVIVLGINSGNYINELIPFVEEREIKFPILHDPEQIIKKTMDFRISPLRITLDENNTILDIVYPSGNYKEEKQALVKLDSLLKEKYEIQTR